MPKCSPRSCAAVRSAMTQAAEPPPDGAPSRASANCGRPTSSRITTAINTTRTTLIPTTVLPRRRTLRLVRADCRFLRTSLDLIQDDSGQRQGLQVNCRIKIVVVQPDIGHHNAPRHELVRQKRQAVIRPEVSELLIASLYVPRNMPGKRNPDVLEHQDVFRKAELPEDLPSGIGAQILNDFRGESFQEETDPGEPSPGPLQGLIRGGAAPQQPSDTDPGFDIVQLCRRHELSNGQCDLGPSFAGTDQDDSVVRRRQMAEAVPQHDCIFLHRAELVGFQQYGMHSRIIQEPSLPREVRPRCRVPLVRGSGNKGTKIKAQSFRDGGSP